MIISKSSLSIWYFWVKFNWRRKREKNFTFIEDIIRMKFFSFILDIEPLLNQSLGPLKLHLCNRTIINSTFQMKENSNSIIYVHIFFHFVILIFLKRKKKKLWAFSHTNTNTPWSFWSSHLSLFSVLHIGHSPHTLKAFLWGTLINLETQIWKKKCQ